MKKVSVCGKGGVGKSFVVYGLAKAFLEKGKKVIVVDTDESNQSLHKFFGFSEPPLDFMGFLGGKEALKERLMQGFRKGEKEPKVKIFEKESYTLEEIPEEFLKKKGNLFLISIGKIKEPMEGCACPMGALSREFLEKIRLKEDEIVIVDTEAGIEHFGRGIEKGVDTIIVVAEPYLDSIEIVEKALALAQKMGKKAYLILNKVPAELENKVKETVERRGLSIAGMIHFYPEVYSFSIEGKIPEKVHAFNEIKEILEKLYA